MTENIATNRNAKGFFVQSIDISSIPSRVENEFERVALFYKAVDDFKKSFEKPSLNPLLSKQGISHD